MLKLAYYASKKAKQEPKNENLYYAVKDAATEELIADGTLLLRGFHQIGEYKKFNGFGIKTKKFYANYFETADGEWSFHQPRVNGRGKGNLGTILDLAQNTKIVKITEEETAILARHPLILRKFKENEKQEIHKKAEKNKQEIKFQNEKKRIEKIINKITTKKNIEKIEIKWQNKGWKPLVIIGNSEPILLHQPDTYTQIKTKIKELVSRRTARLTAQTARLTAQTALQARRDAFFAKITAQKKKPYMMRLYRRLGYRNGGGIDSDWQFQILEKALLLTKEAVLNILSTTNRGHGQQNRLYALIRDAVI